jgi:hypothetical protein
MTPYYKKHTSGHLSQLFAFDDTELWPEHLQELLASSPPSVSFELKYPFFRGNWLTERGAELFETLHPKVTATQSGTGIRAGKTRASLDDCMESVALVCHGRAKVTHGPLAKKGYANASGYYDKAGRYIKIDCPPTFLLPTLPMWELIAKRYGVAIPDNPVLVGRWGLAVGFWDWVRDNNIPVKLAEGVKKAGCLMLLGYAAISLNGIWMGRRVIYRESDGKNIGERLHEDLLEFDTPGREITFTFDYREGNYFQSVEFKAARATAGCLQNAHAFIAQLPGPEKGIDDFAAVGGDVDAVISAARSIDEIQKQFFLWLSKENKKKAWALTHPVAWECNQRYLSIPYHSGLIGVKSPKGTGKTYDLIKLIAQTHAQGRKVLLLTHRIVLGRAICEAVGIPWIEEMNSDADCKTEGKAMGFGLCVDSLHPLSQAAFDPLAWEGALVIVDEVEQVFWHLLNASTCKENRQAILSTMRTLFQSVLSTDGTVRLQDADLSDISIDFVREFAETDIKPWIAVNHWQPSEPWQIKFYDTQHVKGGTKDDPSGLLKDSVDHVMDEGKIWVSCDSQKAKSKHGSKNLEKYYRSRCPGKKILRIDAETVANPEHPAYQCAEKIQGSGKAKEKIKDELAALYDIVICSPSLATGVSVDLRGHFTAVFGIFQGAISDNEVRQSLARVREPVPRFVWCRQIAVGKIGNGESNYKEVAKSKEKDCRYNLQLLRDIDFDLDKAHNPVVLRYWAKYAARINSSIWDFRETVREGLEVEGHILIDCGDDDRDTAGEIKALRILNQVEEAVAVAEAEDIDREQFEKLEQQRSKTDAERYQEEKFRLEEIYKVEVTPELRQLHQDKWFPKIQTEYFLTHNPDFVWMRDRKNIDSQIKNGDGQLCLQDVWQLTGKLKIHELLNTLQFTDRTKEWSNKSPEVLEFASKALKLAADIKDLTGIKVTQEKVAENPIGVVGSFVAQLGRKPKLSEQRRIGKERVRFYRFDTAASFNCFDRAGNKLPEPEGLRAQIFEAWVQRDELALFEFQQKGIAAVEADVTLQAKSAQNLASSNLTSKSGSVTPPSINKEEICSVTTDPTVETPKQQEEGSGSAAEKVWAWYQVKREWIKCRVLEFVEDHYVLQAKSMVDDGWVLFRAFPKDLRWEAPI